MKSFKITQSITDRKDASLGLYFRDVSKLSLISQEEEVELAERVQKGDKRAENELVKANLRFVISVAKSYQGKGLDLVDLIQEGNLGLLESARRYNPNKNIKFISYAVWWIRQAIMKAISDQCRTVRVPMNQISNMRKINKISEKFEQENNRQPTVEEIQEHTNLSYEKIDLSLASTYRSVSLETPFKDEEASCLIDVIPNSNSIPVDNDLEKQDIIRKVDKLITTIPNRESDVVRMSFGIGVQQMSHEEIASRFGIGSERVRQIQQTALRRIRDKYKDKLSELL